jgi:hypothetical protein
MDTPLTIIRTGLIQSAQAHDAQAFEDWLDALICEVADHTIALVREQTINEVLFDANRRN